MGFTEILTIIFVLLKVFDVITWSWWLVFLPEIIAIGLYVLAFLIILLGAGISTTQVFKENKKRK